MWKKTEPDSTSAYAVIGQKASGRRCSNENHDSVLEKGNLNHEKPHDENRVPKKLGEIGQSPALEIFRTKSDNTVNKLE